MIMVMIVIVIMSVRALERLDALGCDDDRRLGAGCFHQPIEPALEAKPVDEDEPGVGDLLGIRRRWRIDMGIAIRSYQGRDFQTVAADIPDEIAEDREAGDDLEPGAR